MKEGVVAEGLLGMRFNTIGVSDGISMGTEGMRFSLPSRDVIADSIETVTLPSSVYCLPSLFAHILLNP